MIFNRLAGSLHRQDWPSVFVELGIVVVGILLALQVENWNQDRREVAEAAVWREQIIEDLKQTRYEMNARLNYNAQALEFAKQALAGLKASGPVDANEAWRVVRGAFQASQISPFQLTGATFREVQNAGGLRRVANPETLRALTHLYDVSAYDFELVSGGLPPYRDLIRQLTPWSLQDYIWGAGCQLRVNDHTGSYETLVDCAKPDLDPAIFQALEEFRAYPELIPQLRGRMSQLRVAANSMGSQIAALDSLIVMLEGGQAN